MRPTLTALPFLLVPALALAQSNMCALPVAAAADAAPPLASTAPARPAEDPNGGFPVIPPAEIAASPALSRLASNGARLLELGPCGTSRIVVAINAGAIGGFTIDPSGRYLTPGGCFDGAETDGAKRNITINQARRIPGAVPTVDLRQQQAQPTAAAPRTDATPADLAAVEQATFGIIGDPAAPRLWMFIDPLCIHSIRAWEEFKPAIAAGKLHLALIPVPVLDPANAGHSTPSAARLVQARSIIDIAWRDEIEAERTRRTVPAPTNEANASMVGNMQVAARVDLAATPLMLWRAPDGTPMRFTGDGQAAAILASMGVK